jgi:hypothetical protein
MSVEMETYPSLNVRREEKKEWYIPVHKKYQPDYCKIFLLTLFMDFML